jgi:hypothetical protein
MIPQAKLLVSGWRKQRHGARHKQATGEVGRHEVARFFFWGASHLRLEADMWVAQHTDQSAEADRENSLFCLMSRWS